MGFLQNIAGIVSWVAGLWMVYMLFKRKGVLHGILGLICELYPFIWGLMNFKDAEIKKPMTIWLIAIAVSIVLGIIGAVAGGAGGGEPTSFLPFYM